MSAAVISGFNRLAREYCEESDRTWRAMGKSSKNKKKTKSQPKPAPMTAKQKIENAEYRVEAWRQECRDVKAKSEIKIKKAFVIGLALGLFIGTIVVLLLKF